MGILRIFIAFQMLFLCCFSGFTQDANVGLKPNIIYILADDLGYGDLSCFNKDSKIATPNLDRLAAQGMMFTNAHAAASVCTPSRYALLTGRNPYHSKLGNGGVLWSYDWPLIENNSPTVAKFLKSNGYQTALIGKWHLGWQWPVKENEFIDTTIFGGRSQKESLMREARIDLSKPLLGGPLSCGFEYYYGVDIPSLPPFCFIENNRIEGSVPDKLSPPNMSGLKGLMQDGWTSEKMLPVIMNKAIDYLGNEYAKQDQTPFFLMLSLTAPHTPIAPVSEFKGKSMAGDYGDLVAEIDDYIGRIMSLIEASGQLQNTLIIFTSDNGPINAGGDLYGANPQLSNFGSLTKFFDHSSGGNFRGMKGDAWEAGHRVPFIANWPGVITAGSSSNKPISLTDFFGTCAGILNISLSDSIAEDSYNIFPLLQQKVISNYASRQVITQSSKGCLSIQNKKWKFINCNYSGGSLTNFYQKDTIVYATSGQLYNLKKDPREKNNLYSRRRNIVQKMATLLRLKQNI